MSQQGAADKEGDSEFDAYESGGLPYCVLLLSDSKEVRAIGPSNFNFVLHNVSPSGFGILGISDQLNLKRVGSPDSDVQKLQMRCAKTVPGAFYKGNEYTEITIGELKAALKGSATVVLPAAKKM